MLQLLLVITGLIAVSFLCSVLESVLLSISRPYIETLVDQHSRAGTILAKFKDNIEEPISAILTLNTISHTVGAAVSGAMALNIFGSEWMALFSGILTLLILVFSEIIPKTIGAHYWKSLSRPSALILKTMVIILKPLIIPVNLMSSLLTKGNPAALVSKAEIYNFIRMGHSQGVIDPPEFDIIENVLKLRDIRVRDIMTPRTVVFWLDEDDTVADIKKRLNDLNFSRIPLYNPAENKIQGIVIRRDILELIAEKKLKTSLKSLSTKPDFVPETISVLKLLNGLVTEKKHIAVVLNEYGDYTGIVTLEDAIESLLGHEIVDEFDPAIDMRKLAEKKTLSQKRKTENKKGGL